MANTVSLRLDAENKKIMCEVLDEDGVLVDSYGQIQIALADLTGTNKVAKFRECTVCVSGVEMSAWILMTDPE